MGKRKSWGNRLMAVLLSLAMVLMPVQPGMTVYAAQAGTGVEGIGAAEEPGSDTGTADGTEPVGGGVDDGVYMTAALMTAQARTASFSNVGGWNESIYAEIAGASDADVTAVSYSGAMTGSLTGDDLKYLVRDIEGGGVRIDIPGLKAGTYTLTVTVGGNTLTQSGITVYEYDRSGYAHFNNTDGVGAYKDDGTLKDNAVVLYVTDENKNDVELTCGGVTVKGIGNILNSAGKDVGGGKTSKGGAANGNAGIIQKLAEAGQPLVVRFVGIVSDSGLYARGSFAAGSACKINGLTTYDSLDNGGSVGDNGHMARMQSGKDITLEGIGYDATIDGWGFHFMAQSGAQAYGKSFEVRNLAFINTPEDAVGMEGVQEGSALTASVDRCWIHNNEFYCPNISDPAESDKAQGDGSVDFKRGQYYTCSYNYFEGCHKTHLVGASDDNVQYNITYHHNHYYMVDSRGPLARQANIHMYNNLVEQQTTVAQDARANSFILSEYNLFYASKSPQKIRGGAVIKSYNDCFSSTIEDKSGVVVTDKTQYVANACKYNRFDIDATLSYIPANDYKLDTDFTQMAKVIASQTGVQARHPKTAEEVTESDYSVIPEGTTVNALELPQELAPGKKSGQGYAFRVEGPFNLEMSGNAAILVNAAGESLLEGNGTLENLPAGTYMLQSTNFQPGTYSGSGSTMVKFKDYEITSLKLTAADPDAHYHNWVKDASKSKEPTCTEAGVNYYTCTVTEPECPDKGVKTETVEALGHDFVWKVITEATETTPGLKRQECSRCDATGAEQEIPAGSTGGGTGGGSTAAGDYVLTFDGGQPSGSTDIFKVTGNCSNSKGTATVNGETYQYCLKMESSTNVSFSCNDGATLFLAFASTETGKKVKVDGKEYTTGSDGTVTVENLSGGSHTIEKKDGINLFYISLTNKGADASIQTLTFEYNYEGAPAAVTVQVAQDASYASMEALAPATFKRDGYELAGLYKDAALTQSVSYPYVVSGDAVFYAEWKTGGLQEASHSIIFETDGGTPVASVKVKESEVYQITEKSTKAGYAFAGWYDAQEGGNRVDKVTGSDMQGDVTLYARWNLTEKVGLELDCTKLTAGNITGKQEYNGFILHAGEGQSADGKTNYYMTVADNGGTNVLKTNGVLLTDKSIPGNDDGLLKSIEFTAEEACTLTVEFSLSSSSGQSNLVLAKKAADGSLEPVGEKFAITSGKTKVSHEFPISEAGTYYLYPEGEKGVYYYHLKVATKAYTINYQPGHGTLPEGIDTSVKKAGEVVTVGDCVADAGYEFKGWSVDNGATTFKGSYTVDAKHAKDGAITLTAYYDLVQYTVNFDANGGTLPGGMEATRQATVEDTLTLGACTPPAEGQMFLGWSVNGSDNEITGSYKVNPADAADVEGKKVITLKAVYTEAGKTYYTVQFDAAGGSLPGTMEASVVKEADDIVELGACTPPTAAQQFLGWSVAGTDKKFTSSYKVNPADAADVEGKKVITLKAVYTEEGKVYYTVKFNADGGSLPEGMDASVTAAAGDVLTLGECVPASADQRFVGWSVGTSTSTITSEYKVKAEDADENHVITLKAVYGVAHSGISIIGLEDSYEYTGAKIIPNIGVVDYDIEEGRLLAPGVDYSVQYKNNSKAGEATVTVTGKGNYAGRDVSRTFGIKEVQNATGELANLKGAKLGKIAAVTYNGSAQHPKFSLTLKGAAAVEYTYDETDRVYKAADGKAIAANVALSNNVNKGTATILITGAKDGKGRPTKLKKTFKITPVDISKATVDVKTQPGTYGAKGAAPASVTVTCNGVKLKNGTDYTVRYSANKKVTEAAGIIITGKGNYTKKYTAAKYAIKQLDLSDVKSGVGIKAVTAYTGMNAGKVKATVTDQDGNVLKASQYTLKVYKDQAGTTEYGAKDKLAEGKIYVKAVAKDTANLTGETAIAEFTAASNIAKAKAVLRKEGRKTMTKTYTGKAVTLDDKDLTLTIKAGGETKELKRGDDYEIVSYSNNIKKGTATAVIKGIGSYSGTKTVKFKIVGKTMHIQDRGNWSDITGLIKEVKGIR